MSEQDIALLNEHQAPEHTNTNQNQAYQPDEEEKKDIKLVYKLFEKAKAARKTIDEKWLDNYKMFRGKQWKETRPSYRHSEVINLIFQAGQSQIPILFDSRPRIEYVPQNPMNTELAQILNDVAESDWQKNNWLYQLTEMGLDGFLYGTGIGDMGFDPKGQFGLGSIDFSSFDPFYFYPQPGIKDVNHKDTRFIVTAEPVDTDILKTQYPDKAKYLKPDLNDFPQGSKDQLNQVRFKSPVDQKTILEGSSTYDIQAKDQTLKITLYMKSDEYIEEQEKSLDLGTQQETTQFVQKLKYPKGRKIVLANGVRLENGPNPFEDGMFKFAAFRNYILPREFWGMSEIEQLESPQKTYNKIISFMLDIFTLMGNPVWVVTSDSGIDTDNLINRPGLVVEKEPGSEADRMPGMEINPTLFQLAEMMRSRFNDMSGSTDVTRGVEPQQITAASAINSLQEAAQTRMRQKSRNLDCTLQDLGKLYLSRVFQFYTSPRIFRVTGNQGAEKYFKFHVDSTQDEQGNEKRVARVQDLNHDPDSGQMTEGPIRDLIVDGEFDVRVSTGSSLPFAKAEKFNKSVTLFKLGVIDDEELLKNADYPNWEAVLARVNAKKAAMAQAQAAAQQGAPPPNPPPLPAPGAA